MGIGNYVVFTHQVEQSGYSQRLVDSPSQAMPVLASGGRLISAISESN